MARDSYLLQKKKLQKEILRLQKQMEGLDSKRRAPQIAAIVKTMREFDITPEEIATAYARKTRRVAAPRKAARASGTPRKGASAPRYRNPETGATWTGRGRAPRWIVEAEASGKSRDQFLIKGSKAAQ